MLTKAAIVQVHVHTTQSVHLLKVNRQKMLLEAEHPTVTNNSMISQGKGCHTVLCIIGEMSLTALRL